MISGMSTGAVKVDGALMTSGTLAITDVDRSDNPISFLDQSATRGDNGYGTFAMTGGNWTYTLDSAHPAVRNLETGKTLTDSHTFTASDGSTQVVTVTINGRHANAGSSSPGPGEGDTLPPRNDNPIQTAPGPKTGEAPPIENESPVSAEIDSNGLRRLHGPGGSRFSWVPARLMVPKISLAAPDRMAQISGGSPLVKVGFFEALKWEPRSASRISRPTETRGSAVTEFFSTEAMLQGLDRIQQEINDQLEMEAAQGKLIIGAATGLAASVLVGYVVWALRAASLLLGALSALPMWRCFDPLPVLLGKDKRRNEDEKRKHDEPEPEVDEKEIRELLDSQRAVETHHAPKGRKNWHEAL